MTNRNRHVLAIAQQSRELAVQVYDAADWRLAASARRVWEEDDGPGMTPDEILSGVITLADATLRRAGITAFDLAAIGVAASPHAVVAWESVSGRPLGMWQTPPHFAGLCAGERDDWLAGQIAAAGAGDVRAPGRLQVGGIESWLIWNLTQGESFVIDVSHDLADGLPEPPADAQDAAHNPPRPPIALPKPVRSLGGVGRIGPIYLEGARTPVAAPASVPVAALFGTGDDKPGAAYIGYRPEGFIAVRVPSADAERPGASGAGESRAAVIGGGRGRVLIGRIFAPQTMIDWVESLFYQRDALPDVAVALFSPGPVVAPARADRPDRAAIVDIGRDTTPAILYAAALRSFAFAAHDCLEAARMRWGLEGGALYSDETGYGIPALFAYQTAVSRRPLYCDKRHAAAFGSALLAAVGAGLLSAARARELARGSGDRERYDIAGEPAGLRELYGRWRNFAGDLV